MSKKDVLREMLLEENGLSDAGPPDVTQRQIAERVLRDHDRARKSQSRAMTAWVLHAILFSLNWGMRLNDNTRWVAEFLGMHVKEGLGWTNVEIFRDPQSLTEIFPAMLFWLNGLVFLFAVLATLIWLQRARNADASADLLYRFRARGK